MDLTPDFLAVVSASEVCKSYYRLCKEHPMRAGFLAKPPFKEVLKAAAGHIELTKLSGPGTVFRLGGLPIGVSLNFIIQGRSVETDFTVSYNQATERGTFATLCYAARAHSKLSLPNPPYPRPEFQSLQELVVIFQSFNILVSKLARISSNAG